jgi:hypothetical protein
MADIDSERFVYAGLIPKDRPFGNGTSFQKGG